MSGLRQHAAVAIDDQHIDRDGRVAEARTLPSLSPVWRPERRAEDRCDSASASDFRRGVRLRDGPQMRSVGACVSRELGEEIAIDLRARGMKIERALRELRQLARSRRRW